MPKKLIDLELLSRFKDKLDTKLDKKANVDGNYPTLTVGLADNFTPYSEDSGTEQTNPFISNGTGTNNNTEIVTVGDYGLFKSKNGNTICVNQLVPNEQKSGTHTPSGSDTYDVVSIPINILANKTYLVIVKLTNNESRQLRAFCNIYGTTTYGSPAIDIPANSSKLCIWKITSTSASQYLPFGFSDILASQNLTQTWSYSDFSLIQLDQMFNGNIPQDLLDNPSHFSWYYNGDLSYNTGTLVNANGVKLVSTGRNIYNPSETYNVVIPNKPFFASKTTTITYYDKDKNVISTESVSAGNTFTTPSNCVFISSSVSAITITPYYTDQEGGEGYLDGNNVPIEYAYEEPYVVDTGSEVLRSAGSVRDVKLPSGEITRKVGSYTFTGEETWINFGVSGAKQTTITDLGAKTYQASELSLIITDSGFVSANRNDIYNGILTNGIAVNGNQISVSTTSGLTGKTIYFELAEPTTEQGTAFAENLPINDYGMIYWLDENDELVGIPQGSSIFYPTNYKGFVDDMYSRVDGDSGKLVLQSEITDTALNARGYYKQVDLSSGITKQINTLIYNPNSPKVIRNGNLVTIMFSAYQSANSIITAGTTLFTLDSSIRPVLNINVSAVIDDDIVKVRIDTSGNITCGSDIGYLKSILFCVTYII